MQDHEYMAKFSQQPNDPFIASCERLQDKYLLMKAMNRKGKTASNLEELKKMASSRVWEENTDGNGARPIASTRTETLKRALWSRVGGALVGGAFLVVPMWLLALRRELYVHLDVTTGCVSGFRIVVAWYVNALEAVFAATLAYAAVLTVFVGVMIQGPNVVN